MMVIKRKLIVLVTLTAGIVPLAAQAVNPAPEPRQLYEQLQMFELGEASTTVRDLVLKRDRVEMHFQTGVVYFERPAAGSIRGAVFIGRGIFKAPVPEQPFEFEHVRRLLNADTIESTFETAVLRFTDDTASVFKLAQSGVSGDREQASELVQDFHARWLRELGINAPARLAVSILNREEPGVFLAEFKGGKRGRFRFIMDHQCRIPTMTFGLSGGEKGLIFAYPHPAAGVETWTAFYSLQDYQNGSAAYSDTFDLVDIESQKMEIDVRNPKKELSLQSAITFRSRMTGVRAIPLALSESLPELDAQRLKKAVRLRSASLSDGSELYAVQEDWEGGLTLFPPRALDRSETLTVVLELAGDFLLDPIPQCHYPRINHQWYPRHGYLARSKFDLTFIHQEKHRVVSVGELVEESSYSEDPSARTTRWRTDIPVAFVTFAVGRFDVHEENVKSEKLGELPLVFYSPPRSIAAVKEDFILAEMLNSVNYFSELFGGYHYPKLGALYHPYGFGQGFASLLLLPSADSSNKYTFAFIAHETAHQWWGNIVAWRSYRDQWLSEGFAEYSGILYTGLRANFNAQRDLIEELRRSLKQPPRTDRGIGSGTLAEVGPLIWGHRLSSTKTGGAYSALIYNKGALVLRMLHFLFTDPRNGDGQAFFDMMSDFVSRYSGQTASTDDFRLVANEHFPKTAIAAIYGFKDLNWFFQQWVYGHEIPKYRLEYSIERSDSGHYLVSGSVIQEGVTDNWVMPLPVWLGSDRKRGGIAIVLAYGPSQPFKVELLEKPKVVELDPNLWVLSSSSDAKRRSGQ